MKMAGSYPNDRKHCGEKKEKLLVTSNFSFFPTVFPKDLYTADTLKRGFFGGGKRVKSCRIRLNLEKKNKKNFEPDHTGNIETVFL